MEIDPLSKHIGSNDDGIVIFLFIDRYISVKISFNGVEKSITVCRRNFYDIVAP